MPAGSDRATATLLLVFVGLATGPLSGDDTLTSDQRRYEQYALTHSGDVTRGRELFLDETRTKCVTCHKIDNRGGDVGPDLSVIGGKFGRPHLIESLLEPSLQIVEGYRSSVIALASGRVLSGIVKEQTERNITLVDQDDKVGTQAVAALKETVGSGAAYGLMLKDHNQSFPFQFDGAPDDPVFYAALKTITSSTNGSNRQHQEPQR